MNSFRKIWFIINPISGGKSNEFLKAIISAYGNEHKWDFSIKMTEFAGHAKVLAQEAVQQNIEIVCAVGGDGTINEIGSELVHTETALAIIPRGSGNGLSRHIKIPNKPAEALDIINENHNISIDVGSCNGQYFFCTVGFALDALVAKKFDEAPTRGLATYLQSAFQEFTRYEARTFTIKNGITTFETSPLLLTVANANQYGNNTFIAPEASLTDHKLNLCSLSSIPSAHWLNCGYSLMSGNIHKFKFYTSLLIEEVNISSKEAFYYHIDGEPREKITNAAIAIKKQALKVITPSFFEG